MLFRSLAMARYSGIITEKVQTQEVLELSGISGVAFLGDSNGVGPVIETEISLSASTLDNAVTQILAQQTDFTKGTINEPAGTTTQDLQWVTCLDGLRTVCASMGVEYRANPDFTLDAGPQANVYNDTTPTIIVTRGILSGGDVLYRGVTVDQMDSRLDAGAYATRSVVLVEHNSGALESAGGQDRTPTPTYYGPGGSVIDRTLVFEASGEPVSVTTYLTTQMNEYSIVQNMEISTDFVEIQNGDLRVGDSFWCWDPPAFYDNNNEVHFRGEVINPSKLRLIRATWSPIPSMGIYYRPPTAAPAALDWHDLTKFVRYEGSGTTLGVRR